MNISNKFLTRALLGALILFPGTICMAAEGTTGGLGGSGLTAIDLMLMQSLQGGKHGYKHEDMFKVLAAHKESLEELLPYVDGVNKIEGKIAVLQGKREVLNQQIEGVHSGILAAVSDDATGKQENQQSALEKSLSLLAASLQRVENEIKSFEKLQARVNSLGKDGVTKLRADITKMEDAITTHLESQLKQQEGLNNPVRKAIFHGLAGRDFMYIFQNASFNSFGQAVQAGLLARMFSVAGKKFEEGCAEHMGKAGRTVFGFFATRFQRLHDWVFHGGVSPYSVRQLDLMKKQVYDVMLKGLSDRAKTSQAQQCDGLNSNSRLPFDYFDGGSAQAESGAGNEDPADPTWTNMMNRYAQDFDRIVHRLELHKAYYAPTSPNDDDFEVDGRADIIAIADRLQDTLVYMKQHLLLPSKKLGDLALSDVKLLLEHTVSELIERFNRLSEAVSAYHNDLPIGNSSTQRESASRALNDSSDYMLGLR